MTPRQYRFDLGLAALIALLCAIPWGYPVAYPGAPVTVLATVAVATRRWNPSVALAAGWVAGILQVLLAQRPSFVEVALAIVLYSSAAHGRRFEVVSAGVSAVLGGMLGAVALWQQGMIGEAVLYGLGLDAGVNASADVILSLLPIAVLASSWLVGFARRTTLANRDQTQLRLAAETVADEALDVARTAQVRTAMARDVHDVVGHSLAVIIAQADSVQFIEDPHAVREVIATIARTARTSLVEVRGVIGATGQTQVIDPEDFDALLEPVRSAGVPLEYAVRGDARPLTAEIAVVVRRILQEMLTNALRHGRSGEPVVVRVSWRADDLIVEVENVVGDVSGDVAGGGIEGMQTRLTGIGGALDAGLVEDHFIARARIPAPAEGVE